MKTKIIIGTRGSKLALWQAHFTQKLLAENGIDAELKIIKTSGDISQAWNLSFEKMEGKGFFTKELEDALLSGEIDLAVHSCKDLPTENPEGLCIGAYSYRDRPEDVLLVRPEAYDASQAIPLKKGALVGTSSARRKSQLLFHRPDLELKDLRGNVPTRIEKIQSGQYDAIVLAAAGLRRLEIEADGLMEVLLGAPLYIPAPAQGILAYQIRQQDTEMQQVCKLLHHPEAYESVALEREILHDFHGGCQIPLGVYVQKSDDNFHLWIAKGEQWNAPVARFYHRWKASESFSASYFVEKFNQIKACKVFISRDLNNDDIFYRSLTDLHFEVNGKSLVDIRPANFELPNTADYIFFTSKNGVKYFFDQFQQEGKRPAFAAINSATAMAIVQAGYDVAFIGQHNDSAQTMEDFSTIAHGRIYFAQAAQPIADHAQSLRKKGFDAHSLTVYHNSPLTDIAPIAADILVFTSPMNVRAYFSQQSLQPQQRIVSIGPSTTAALTALGISPIESYDPMPWSLVDRVIWSSILAVK